MDTVNAPEIAHDDTVWTRWSDRRPTDVNAIYRWRVSERKILNKMLRPEWSEKLHYVGMGYSDSEYWPIFSNWDGYRRTVDPTLDWRLATEEETEQGIVWNGFDLLPNPFTNIPPRIGYIGKYASAPPYKAESMYISSYLISGSCWYDAQIMQDRWNKRPDPT